MTAKEKIVRTAVLRLQFPVSSGTQHHIKESEWIPAEKQPQLAIEGVPKSTPRSISPKLRCPIISAAGTAQEIAANSVPVEPEIDFTTGVEGRVIFFCLSS